MSKKIILAALVMITGGLALTGCRTQRNALGDRERSIVILYENDAHCNIDGYARLAGIRDAIADTAWTATVSSGDYLQGGTAGAISKGEYIIDIMKKVGYDAVALGNHEFDYKMPRMFQLLKGLHAPVTCVNLYHTADSKRVFAPYVMKKMGGKKVAFIGATTPTTMETESYAFYDMQGRTQYDLRQKEVYSLVQEAVDEVRRKGADFVVILTHLGEDKNEMDVDSHGLIANTRGIDVVLDGHTHSVVPQERVKNVDGEWVQISQTGTKFANVGKLVIMPDGRISTTLLPVNEISQSSDRVRKATEQVKAQMEAVTEKRICQSDVMLRILDERGKQLVRMGETNAGDLVADAFRLMTGADIAMNNGGGIRTELQAGELTYGDIVSLLPYDNYLCVVEVTGDKVLEVLQANTSLLPHEDGQFPQVSGIRYTAVVKDHTVKDVEVLNPKTNRYEPLDRKRTYTLCTTDYCITGGGFRNVLREAKVTQDAVMLYNEALVQYVTKKLGGHIGKEYAEPQGRIRVE